jgi:hypothetical protein
MIGGYAVTDQPEWDWEPVDDCDLDRHITLLAEGLGGVDPGRPCSHNGHDEGLGRRCTIDQLNTTGSLCGAAAS